MPEDQAALRRRLRPRPRSSLPLINWSLPKISSPADYLKAYPDLMSTMVITEVVTICDKVTTLRKSNQLGVGVFKGKVMKIQCSSGILKESPFFPFCHQHVILMRACKIKSPNTVVFNCRKEKFKVWNRSRRNLEEFPDWFRKTYWLPSSFKKCMCARLPLSCSLSLSSRDLLSLTETVWRAIQLEMVLVEFWKRPGSLPPPPWLCSKSPKNFRQTQWIWFYFTF